MSRALVDGVTLVEQDEVGKHGVKQITGLVDGEYNRAALVGQFPQDLDD